MDSDRLTQQTQDVADVDPRRMGLNNSGLSVEDISDVLCILHPCTPASFKLVAATAKRSMQHVLKHESYANFPYDVSPSLAEEQETFIITNDSANPPMDLALRFSSRTVQPLLGFTFGRSPQMCDIVVPSDTHKRISNLHFAISVTDSGVLMLSDMSTNGTLVDEVLLRGKKNYENRARMLTPGSIIQILSPTPAECLKFIVRFPSREGHVEEYEAKFQAYTERIANIHAQQARKGHPGQNLLVQPRPTSTIIRAPIAHNQYGMHWSGGDKYNVVGQIGKGAFACVYQLATKNDGQLYAAKELEKRKFMKNGILDRKLDNEMQIMKSLSHPNIVQYVDYHDVGNHLYIIMEFVACGDLQQYLTTQLNTNSPLPEGMAKRMAAQVFDALHYLHLKQITHRDIKPDNILIADLDPENFNVKLSDFGLSKVVKNDDTFLKTFCGTLLYCAPEVFPHYDEHVSGKGVKRPRKGLSQRPIKFHSYSQSVDVWSFGAVLWYALCLKPPFEGVTDTTGRGMFEKIMMTPLDATVLMKQGVSDEAISLLVQMLNTDPASRPTPVYCMKHPWLGHKLASNEQLAIGLGVITEEAEGDMSPVGAPDVSGLSLNELPTSQNSELSFNSGDIAFFDVRESKRFKPDDDAYRDPGDPIDSSPEAFYQPMPISDDGENKSKTGKPKLFGEISQSDLRDGAFGIRANSASRGNGNVGSSDGSVDHERRSHTSNQGSRNSSTRGAINLPGLMGAESQIRDMHMADSPYSSGSYNSGVADRKTPEAVPHASTPSKNYDITPKPVQPVKMNRQINIPIPPSFFYEADDPSTHTLEYASKASGIDFTAKALYSQPPIHSQVPSHQKSRSPQREQPNHSSPFRSSPHPTTRIPSSIEPAHRPAPQPTDTSSEALYGRLVSTPDSFANITINLNARMTKWGRAPDNTHIYPDPSDTRIPKNGIVLYFYAAGIDSLTSQIDDWTPLPGLYTGLTTYSRLGLTVNGRPLRNAASPEEDQPYARVHSGDIIEVFPPSRDGRRGLAFTCEIYFGSGKDSRLPGEEFKVEMGAKSKVKGRGGSAEGSETGSNGGRGGRGRGEDLSDAFQTSKVAAR